ncbi:DNA topoisomerase [Stomatobaculum longum]|jgi:DNA topoisomerase|uniref:DNA topoisomerase n=1 Tax=Stomatobaculum longum TaxID=796942 RepID=UPI00280514F8|nr:DNA topoisomerase [Stomatobaculum longum]
MENQTIRDSFNQLKPSTKCDALFETVLCRERSDWIAGINATRLFSCLYGSTLNVDRVMIPTLAMVVMRDTEIAVFRSTPFYLV